MYKNVYKHFQNTAKNFPNENTFDRKKNYRRDSRAILRDRQGHFEGQLGHWNTCKPTRHNKMSVQV